MSNLLGVVLSGGQSKRMGRDKGLMDIGNTKWAVSIAEKLRNLGLDVVVSVNESQKDAYREIFPNNHLIIDNTSISGPLNGLLSVHKAYPDKDLLLMACDLIDMDEPTLSHLVEAYKSEPGFEFYIYSLDGFTEPFCAIYTAKALAHIYHNMEAHEIKKYSLHERFEDGNTKYIPIKDTKVFNNYNSL